MLGNWSLGDYFKKEQIEWMFEFLTQELKLDPNRIYVSVFRGDEKIGIPRDDEAVELWQERFKSTGVEAKAVDMAEKNGMQDGRIFYYDAKENWWSRSGTPDQMPVGEPGGPDSEMFWDFGVDLKIHENSQYKDQPCHPACDCGRFLEIGNNVFMSYIKTETGFETLENKNIDFGGGLERMAVAVLDNPDVFMSDLFTGMKMKLEEMTGKKYKESDDITNSFRIVMDHLRGATFIMGDDKGVSPSNTDQGYIVRRLIRRAIRFGKQLGIEQELWLKEITTVVINDYKEAYPELERNKDFILEQLEKEERQFSKTLEKGLREFKKWSRVTPFWASEENILEKINNTPKIVPGYVIFKLFTTYGFPIEMIKEIAKEKGLEIDEDGFKNKMKEHQETSRTAAAGKFASGLADHSEETTRLHTAAHLLLAALQKVLAPDVIQRGSNITAERLRFDFAWAEKMTDEQKQKVEDLVNQKIKGDIEVEFKEMPIEEAREQGASGIFGDKYGDMVKVYKVGDFSHELCSGPHVERTGELGHFKITKEQSSSAGVRRIKAVLEN